MTYKVLDKIGAKEVEKALSWLKKFWDKPVYPDYFHARSIEEALSLLDEYDDEARIIAGGVDLLGLIKNRVIVPRALVNIKTIPELRFIKETSTGMTIGPLTTINELERSALIREKHSVIADAAHAIGAPQIRNMGTVAGDLCQDVRCWYYRRPPSTGTTYNCRRKCETGVCYAADGENQYHAIVSGNQCSAVCPSDLATVFLAMDARINTVKKSVRRRITVNELYTNLGNTLETGELITSIDIPHTSGLQQRFIKFRVRKAIDFAIVSVATSLEIENDVVKGARVVLGGVSTTPYRAIKAEELLTGEKLSESLARKAAQVSVSELKPLSKNGYKVPVLQALVRRALLGEDK